MFQASYKLEIHSRDDCGQSVLDGPIRVPRGEVLLWAGDYLKIEVTFGTRMVREFFEIRQHA